MELGASIKAIRKEKGVSQKRLAELCDISVTALVQIENNTSIPKKITFKRIAEVLNVSESYILFCALDENDVPVEKRDMFSTVSPIMKKLLA